MASFIGLYMQAYPIAEEQVNAKTFCPFFSWNNPVTVKHFLLFTDGYFIS